MLYVPTCIRLNFIKLVSLMYILVFVRQKLEKEAYDVMEIATSGKFLDPAQNPTHILVAMKRVGF